MGLLTLLGSLASIAIMIGLPRAVDYIGDVKSQARKVSEVDIVDIVNTMYNEASKKGQNAINVLNNKLNSIPFGGYSGRVRDVINNHKRKIRNEIQRVETSMNDITTRAQGIERKANTLMMMSDDYRRSDLGRNEVKKLQNDAKQLVTDASLVEQSIKEK